MLPITVGVAVVGIALLICVAVAIRSRATFEERFPPISDEEFMARCAPGTSREVALKVRRIVADHLAVEYGRIYPSTGFVEDIGA
jgi:hypothetical protein